MQAHPPPLRSPPLSTAPLRAGNPSQTPAHRPVFWPPTAHSQHRQGLEQPPSSAASAARGALFFSHRSPARCPHFSLATKDPLTGRPVFSFRSPPSSHFLHSLLHLLSSPPPSQLFNFSLAASIFFWFSFPKACHLIFPGPNTPSNRFHRIL